MSDNNCCNVELTLSESPILTLDALGDSYIGEMPTMSTIQKGGAKVGAGLEVDSDEYLNIAPSGVVSSMIDNAAITTEKLADGAVTSAKVADESITPAKLSGSVIDMFDGNVKAFDTVAGMQTASNLQAGDICHTNGFHTSGDGGAAFYKITATGTANGMDVLACGNVFANLVITESYVTPEMFGAVGDGVADDTAKIQAAFNSGLSVVFSNAYNCGTVSISDISGARYSGEVGAAFTGNVYMTFTNCNEIIFESLKFDSCTNSARTVYLADCDGVTFRNCAFSNFEYSAVQITRSTTTATSKNYLFDSCVFENVNTSETWGGGVYWDGLGTNGSDGLPAKQISNVRVSNCVFENVGCAGVNSGGCIGLIITGNICDQNNASYTATMGLVTSSRESSEILVDGNIILHTKFEGAIFARSSDVVVSNNYFYDCKACIAFESSSSNCLSTGNRIDGGYSGGLINNGVVGYGVLTQKSTNIEVSNNTIDNCYNGVYISSGTQGIIISGNTIDTYDACVTGAQSTNEMQTNNVAVMNNSLKCAFQPIAAIMHSGIYKIIGNILETSTPATMSAIRLYKPFDVSDYEYHITNNIVKNGAYALDLSNLATNQTNGVVHLFAYDNDFSKCSAVYKKDANARILAFSYARNKKIMTAVELFGHFDRNSELEYNGTLAALLAETPGGQNMAYVRWQIGSVVKCNDSFIHVTRAGNPGTGATMQYKEF